MKCPDIGRTSTRFTLKWYRKSKPLISAKTEDEVMNQMIWVKVSFISPFSNSAFKPLFQSVLPPVRSEVLSLHNVLVDDPLLYTLPHCTDPDNRTNEDQRVKMEGFLFLLYISNTQINTVIQEADHFSAAFALGSLSVQRDWNALSISLQVKWAPFITRFSPSTAITKIYVMTQSDTVKRARTGVWGKHLYFGFMLGSVSLINELHCIIIKLLHSYSVSIRLRSCI